MAAVFSPWIGCIVYLFNDLCFLMFVPAIWKLQWSIHPQLGPPRSSQGATLGITLSQDLTEKTAWFLGTTSWYYLAYPIIYMVLYILLHYNIGGFRKKDFFHPSVIPTFLWSLVESSQSIFPRPQIGWFFMEIQKPQTWNCSWWLHGYEWISMHISELVNLTDKKCCILGTWKNPVKSSLRSPLRLSSHVVLIFREGMETFDISTMSIMIQTGITRWYWQLIRRWWFLSATKKCRHIWTCLLEVPCSDAVWLSSTSFTPSWGDSVKWSVMGGSEVTEETHWKKPVNFFPAWN